MITSFAVECIEGTLKKVQTIVYSNGVKVKHFFEPQAVVPEEVKIITNAQEEIVHPEALQYMYHFGM